MVIYFQPQVKISTRCKSSLSFRMVIGSQIRRKRIIGILYIHQGTYQLIRHIPDRPITSRQIGIHIVDNCAMNIRIPLQHIEKHGSPSYKRFNISHIIPCIKASRQLCIQLLYELCLAAHPLDKRFCFCHINIFMYRCSAQS